MSGIQKTISSASAALIALSLGGMAQSANAEFITIGTGGATGVYYPTGGAVCRLVNRHRAETGIRCAVESTGGSVYNLNAIASGALELGVAQSDWQYHAYNGSSKFADQGANNELRALFSVHSEPFTVVARADAGVSNFDELKGKRVNIGNEGSGQRGTMEVLMAAKGWKNADFAETLELKSSDQAQALCDNKVDAIVFTAGHPSNSIQAATTLCDTVLVEVSGAEVDQLVADNPFYAPAVIPGGMYRGNPDDVSTFGVKATVVSSTKISPETAYQMVKAVFEEIADFRKIHPAFANLDPADMVNNGNSAPFHAGAERYYREAGLLQ